jgi:hypothetical protein
MKAKEKKSFLYIECSQSEKADWVRKSKKSGKNKLDAWVKGILNEESH